MVNLESLIYMRNLYFIELYSISETKRIVTESPEEPDNENFVEENNNDLEFHWCISSPSHPYYSLPSPKSPTSSWDSYDAISGPPTPPSPARSIESVHSVPDCKLSIFSSRSVIETAFS